MSITFLCTSWYRLDLGCRFKIRKILTLQCSTPNFWEAFYWNKSLAQGTKVGRRAQNSLWNQSPVTILATALSDNRIKINHMFFILTTRELSVNITDLGASILAGPPKLYQESVPPAVLHLNLQRFRLMHRFDPPIRYR